MMLNPTKEELELREKITQSKDKSEKEKLEKELFTLVEKRFQEIKESPFC